MSGLQIADNASAIDRLWSSFHGRTSQVFDVIAESDANIFLRTDVGQTVYQIELLKSSTNLSCITNILLGKTNCKETPFLLIEKGYSTLWVSWNSTVIALGMGPSVGENEVLSLDHRVEEHINAIGFSTNLAATWMIIGEMSKYFFLIGCTLQ